MTDNTKVRGVQVVLSTESAGYESGLAAAQASMAKFTAANDRAAARIGVNSKVIQQAGLNLSRQFTDIGVSLAGGSSPFLVLTQQLPQVADAFAQAKMQGAGFGDVVKGQLAGLARAAPVIGTVGVAVGAAVGAFALFERAVDKQTKGATTFGETWQATLNVVGKAIMDGPIGAGLKWMSTAFGRVFDAITNATMKFIDHFVGQYGAAYELIVKNWRRLPEVFGVIVEAGANNVIRGVEMLVNGAIGGLNHLLKAAGVGAIGLIDLPEIRLANRALAAEFEASATSIRGNFRAGRESFFGQIVAETDRLHAANQKAAKSGDAQARALKKQKAEADAAAEAFKRLRDQIDGFTDGLVKQVRDLGLSPLQKLQRDLRDGLAAVSAFEGGLQTTVGAAARLNAEVLERQAEAMAMLKVEMTSTKDGLSATTTALENQVDLVEALATAFGQVQGSVDGVFRSIRSGDVGRLLFDVQSLGAGIQSLLRQGGSGLLSLGSIAANTIGGSTGRAIGGGLGIAASGVGLGAFAGTAAGATALGAAGLSAGAISSVAALAPPLALVAGALYAAAKIFNIGGKPSNAGAGFDLVTGQLSGNKRTAETEGAARSAGEAILGIQDALKAAGLGLTDTVRGLVIGTRDQTQIYLASGKTLAAAVGDSGAAVDAALRELLAGATYVSDAQKRLVESALATGRGFDAVSEVLAKYEAAQGISGELADRILRLTDPKAFDLNAIKSAIQAERDVAAQLARDGALTAEQLATINGQLDRLQALEIDQILGRYGEKVVEAGVDLQKAVDSARGAWDDAVRDLEQSRDAEIEVLARTRDELVRTADSLAAFRQEVSAQGLNADPRRALAAARAAFANNTDAGRIPELGRALLAASEAGARSAVELARDRAAVLRSAGQAESAARAEASAVERQIQAIQLRVAALLPLVPAVQSVDVSIQKLTAAAEALAAAQASAAAVIASAASAVNDNLAVSASIAAAAAPLDASGAITRADIAATAGASATSSLAPGEVALADILRAVAVNTGLTAGYLDDATQGGDAFRTVAA